MCSRKVECGLPEVEFCNGPRAKVVVKKRRFLRKPEVMVKEGRRHCGMCRMANTRIRGDVDEAMGSDISKFTGREKEGDRRISVTIGDALGMDGRIQGPGDRGGEGEWVATIREGEYSHSRVSSHSREGRPESGCIVIST